MKTNKEIITEIVDNLDLIYPTSKMSKLNKKILIECWSNLDNIVDWKYYGYSNSSSLSLPYKMLFINIDSTGKTPSERWKAYILRIHNYKQCNKCTNIQDLNNFSADKNTPSRRTSICKKCKNKYYYTNKEHILSKQKMYNSESKEKIKVYQKQYRDNNKESIAESKRNWLNGNKGMHNASCAKQKIKRLKRIPCWSTKIDERKIKDLYIKAKELEKKHGIKYHVDHIIPLQGKLVSGLHILSNLQIITAKDNMSKSNKYIIG